MEALISLACQVGVRVGNCILLGKEQPVPLLKLILAFGIAVGSVLLRAASLPV